LAHHKSTIKRIRQNKKRYERNRFYRTRLKNSIKAVREALKNENIEYSAAEELLRKAVSTINHIGSKGVIPKKRASRITSRLTLLVNRSASKKSAAE